MKTALAFAATIVLSTAPVYAQAANVSALPSVIVVRDAWSRPALKAGTGVIYLVIENNGSNAVRLASIQSAIARSVEIHQSMQHEGNTTMHPIADITVAPRARYDMTPGNVHVMLIGLAKALVAGDNIPFTLTFADGSKVKATSVVRVP